jgi:hypothetical protein
MIGKGIADSPLPLIFGARADELKQRFSMRMERIQDGTIILYARPLLIEDQREFIELNVMLARDLRAMALKKYDINGKSYKVYALNLRSTKINDRIGQILEDLRGIFSSEIPRGWKHEIQNL